MRSPFATWSLRSRLSLGILLLTALGFLVASFATQSLLKGYLLTQVDDQLVAISEAAIPRIERGGIAIDEDDDEHPGRGLGRGPGASTPLSQIPTSTSITLLDSNGSLIGGLGGNLGTPSITSYLAGLLPGEVAVHGDEAFTIEAPGPDFRVIARPLTSPSGTFIAAQNLGELDRTLSRLTFLFSLIGLSLLLLIAFASRSVITIGLRPLEDAEKTAGEIASGNLSARMPDANPSTEVGRLVTSLNTMLARIEEAFAVRTESENKLRRFVADASHELRTPLTAIRGFAELHRQGAVVGEEKTKELISRIEKESIRMGALVEDLLLLARLDQSRELTSDPVDINHLVTEAVASAKAAGPGHEITVLSQSDEVFVLGDSMRIHQAIANLLANARTHTPVGTKIAVKISQNDLETRISISDNGPGLSEADQKRVFERFFRADPSRVRVSGEGSGLGLAIVDAVMKAHGGSVEVESKLGEGASFTIIFPQKEL